VLLASDYSVDLIGGDSGVDRNEAIKTFFDQNESDTMNMRATVATSQRFTEAQRQQYRRGNEEHMRATVTGLSRQITDADREQMRRGHQEYMESRS